jgi:hypothetical protein
MQHLVGFLGELQAVGWARARGVNHKGEPLRLGRPPVNTATERDIRKLRLRGMGILEIASTWHPAAIDPKTGKAAGREGMIFFFGIARARAI